MTQFPRRFAIFETRSSSWGPARRFANRRAPRLPSSYPRKQPAVIPSQHTSVPFHSPNNAPAAVLRRLEGTGSSTSRASRRAMMPPVNQEGELTAATLAPSRRKVSWNATNGTRMKSRTITPTRSQRII